MDDGTIELGAPQTPSDGSSDATPQSEPPPPTDAAPAPAKDESAAETTQVIAKAVRYVKAKRGGDLAAVILAGSAARDAMTSHSDVDLLVLSWARTTVTSWSGYSPASSRSAISVHPRPRSRSIRPRACPSSCARPASSTNWKRPDRNYYRKPMPASGRGHPL